MAGARLSIAPNGWRDEDCAKWLVRGLRIEPNGCEWPQHKKATIKWQFGDRDGQMKKLWRGNRPVTPAKRKNRGTAIKDHAGLFKNRGGASHRPLENSRWPRNNQQRQRWPEETANPNRIWNGKRIAPVKRKIAARQSRIAPAKIKSRRGNRVSRRPTETSRHGNRRSRRPKEKLRHGNRGSRRPK